MRYRESRTRGPGRPLRKKRAEQGFVEESDGRYIVYFKETRMREFLSL